MSTYYALVVQEHDADSPLEVSLHNTLAEALAALREGFAGDFFEDEEIDAPDSYLLDAMVEYGICHRADVYACRVGCGPGIPAPTRVDREERDARAGPTA